MRFWLPTATNCRPSNQTRLMAKPGGAAASTRPVRQVAPSSLETAQSAIAPTATQTPLP